MRALLSINWREGKYEVSDRGDYTPNGRWEDRYHQTETAAEVHNDTMLAWVYSPRLTVVVLAIAAFVKGTNTNVCLYSSVSLATCTMKYKATCSIPPQF